MSPANKVTIGAALLTLLVCALWLVFLGPSLDRAQSRFEHSATWPAPADFDAWRSSKAMKCRDRKTLRTCEASWPLFSPADGKPFGKDRVTFACSTYECAWVDP